MRTSLFRGFVVIVCIWTCVTSAIAAASGKVVGEAIERLLDDVLRRGGQEVVDPVVRKSTRATIERLTAEYGEEVLVVVREGGVGLLDAAGRHGDDVIQLAIKASPAGRRALAANASELMPLARRVGVEVVEIEAKAPGIASRVFTAFGDDGGKILAKHAPAEDLPRLLAYAEKADNPATRKALLEAYQRESRSLFERIPPKMVISSGLTTAMILGTHNVTESIGDAIVNSPEVAKVAVRNLIGWGSFTVGSVVFCVLWRFRLLPWQQNAVFRRKQGRRSVTR